MGRGETQLPEIIDAPSEAEQLHTVRLICRRYIDGKLTAAAAKDILERLGLVDPGHVWVYYSDAESKRRKVTTAEYKKILERREQSRPGIHKEDAVLRSSCVPEVDILAAVETMRQGLSMLDLDML
jgi:hypothetical protein